MSRSRRNRPALVAAVLVALAAGLVMLAFIVRGDDEPPRATDPTVVRML